MDEGLELICMQIITNTGSAKSSYMEAIGKAKEGDGEAVRTLMDQGDRFYMAAHEVHVGLIQQEAAGKKTGFSLILMHAEDQMCSTEMAKEMANEFIDLYLSGRSVK